jgi:hypothetical protein
MWARNSGPLAIYPEQLGCRAAAVDYGPYAKTFRETVADRGVDYRECDLTCEPLPLADRPFEFECRVIDHDLESLRHYGAVADARYPYPIHATSSCCARNGRLTAPKYIV